MNPFLHLKASWEATRNAVAFSRPAMNPETAALEVIGYVAVPSPGTDCYDVTITVTGTDKHSETRETWSREKLIRTHQHVARLVAEIA